MTKATEILKSIDGRQQSLEQSFAVHQEYTKNMYDALAKDIKLVLDQTTKTNGRVSYLEDERLPTLERWRAKLGGIWFALSLIGIIFGTIVGTLISWYGLTH